MTTTNTAIRVTPNPDGTPTIRWDMSVETADTVMTLLASAPRTDPSPDTTTLLDSLYRAVSEATDLATPNHAGCPDLWPDTAPMPLTEPAVLGSYTGDLLAVLIPGTPGPLDAVQTAVDVARQGGADLDPTDETLMAEVHPARWMVLNTCESTSHDFHPALAPHGPRTPGAVLITRVNLTHD